MTRIVMVPTGIRGERGQRYHVLYSGEILVEDTWSPEYDAARALVAKGITGKVEVWRDGNAALTMDVEGAAKLTIVENANVGPRLGTWMAFSPYRAAPPAAVSASRVLEPADEDGRW